MSADGIEYELTGARLSDGLETTVYFDGTDREGFSAGSRQFDSDITIERHPRCALVTAMPFDRA